MTALLARPIQKMWSHWRQRPFAVLIRLFVTRVLYGGGDGSSEEPELGMGLGLVLTILALPGGFISILLFDKYGSLLQWVRGERNFDPYAASLPDEYFFIVLSIVVTGAVVIWKWESIFPSRRDFMNLVPLPIPMRSIFLANLLALLGMTGVLALDVNAASSVLFPAVVAGSAGSFSYFLRFAFAHLLSVVLASVFTFLSIFSLLGLLMAVLPRAAFRKNSPFIRGILVIALLTLLVTAFAVPALLQKLPKLPNSWVRLLPSGWFLGLFRVLLGGAGPTSSSLATSAWLGLTAALTIGILSYAAGYRRYFTRIPETAEIGSSNRGPRFLWLGMLLDRFILRSAFQRGCFRFAWKTLVRSERHALAVASFTGLALVLTSQSLLRGFNGNHGLHYDGLSADVLSAPLILAFCMIVGIRAAFEIPVELRANWTFRLLLDSKHHEAVAVAEKIVLLLVLPWLLGSALLAYVYLDGWKAGLLHVSVVALWSVLLTKLVLLQFRKLPFTCSLPAFRQHAIAGMAIVVLAFIVFAILTAEIESWALLEPIRMIIFVPPVLGTAYFIYRVRAETIEFDKQLIFEEIPDKAVEVLQLGDIT